MDRGSIVLKSISCRGVKSFNLFQKPSTFAIVSIAAGNDDRQKRKQLIKKKTSADHEGGENPEWDQTIQFHLDESDFQNLFLEFAIMAQGNLLLFGDKLIGKSRVPMIDLSAGHPSDVVRHVSYQIRSPEGKPNGVLSFSYSLNIPKLEVMIPPPMDDYIPPPAPPMGDYIPPPAPPMDDYIPPSAPQRSSIYPPLPSPEAEQEDCCCYCNQPPPPHPPKYYPPPPPPDPPKYYPPPPPPPAAGHYPAIDRSVDAYFSTPAAANGGYYTPPAASLPPPMPEFATYYPSSAPGYIYPPPQNSSGHWNCR